MARHGALTQLLASPIATARHRPPTVDAVTACLGALAASLAAVDDSRNTVAASSPPPVQQAQQPAAPAAATAPPTLAECDARLSSAAKQLADETRELGFVEEELNDDSISEKRYRQLAKKQVC